MINIRFLYLGTIAAILGHLSGCGEGLSPSVSGVVAVGAPVPEAKVTLTDATGLVVTTITDAQGNYSFNGQTQKLTPPFVITASGSIGTQEVSLNSVAAPILGLGATTANVTPLTTAITALIASSSSNYDPNLVRPSDVSSAALSAASKTVVDSIASTVSEAKVNGFDPIGTPFKADRTGVDQVLDSVGVRLRPYGVALSNKLEVLDSNKDVSSVVLNAASPSGSWPTGDKVVKSPSKALGVFEKAIKDCFAQNAATRSGNASVIDDGGYISVAENSIASICKSFVYSKNGELDYYHQSYQFGDYWGSWLSNTDFDSASVSVNLLYVTNPTFAPYSTDGDGKAYVVNVNIKDKFGNWYTRPEVLVRLNANDPTLDSFKLAGNHRPLEFSVQPGFTYLNERTNQSNNRVEGRLSFFITPHRSVKSPDSPQNYSKTSASFSYDPRTTEIDQSNNNYRKPMPKLICGWITGPFLQISGTEHNPDAPKGGILLKIPHPSAVNIRNYMGIQNKYPSNFDPINNTNDLKTLYGDCIASYLPNLQKSASPATFTGKIISTLNTNSAYTIDGAATATLGWRYASNISNDGSPTTSSNRYSYTNFRPINVSSDEQNDYAKLYGPGEMARFTAYFFKVPDNYTGNTNLMDADPWGGSYTNFWANRVQFPAPVRMVGSMPFVPKDNNGVYNGDIKFRTLDSSVIDNYLGQGVGSEIAIPTATQLNLSWSVPSGAQGVDRIGGTSKAFCYYANSTVGSPLTGLVTTVFGSVSQISEQVSRNAKSGSLILSSQWPSSTAVVGNIPSGWTIPSNCLTPTSGVSSVSVFYRDIWTRSYDTENRQIQYVANRFSTR